MADNIHTAAGLAQLQSLPLRAKVRLSTLRIRQWYERNGGAVAVAYSGGLDSTALGHLAQSIYPDIPLVFHDSMLEFPENRGQAKRAGAVFTKSEKTPAEVFKQYGYPVVSKDTAQKIYEAKKWPGCFKNHVLGIKKNDEPTHSRRIPSKWLYLLNAPFPISHLCCETFKKSPSKKYCKETGRSMLVGVRAAESRLRTRQWCNKGCNSFDGPYPRSWPLAFWTDADVTQYIADEQIPYSKLYDMGYKRSGCMFCLFGCHLEGSPNRIQRLAKTHPAVWKYCMDKCGLREVMAYLRLNPDPRPEFDL